MSTPLSSPDLGLYGTPMPLSTRNQPIHPRREEPPTDSPQTTYRSTRADYTALTQTIQPGDRLYAVTDEYVVTDTPSAIANGPTVHPIDRPAALIPLSLLLVRYRAIHTQPPTERTPK